MWRVSVGPSRSKFACRLIPGNPAVVEPPRVARRPISVRLTPVRHSALAPQRAGLVVLLTVAALLAPAGIAVAGPSPSVSPSAPAGPTPGKKLCSIAEPALAEISGLVTTKKGYVAVSDGSQSESAVLEVFDLNTRCQVTQRHTFQKDPYAPEDLAITKDGTLWVADTGDTDLERDRVALWKISPDRKTATIYRLTYPDGKHDAEALLMQPNGKPVIVTKDLDGGGVSGIYVANSPLKPEASTPLTKAGEFKVSSTGTGGNRFGVVGQKLVTGATLSPDGKRAVVRTYSDAYEWTVSGGNVVAALTKGKPFRTPLPDEPQGEAIAISQDGKTYVTATEGTSNDRPRLFSYAPTPPAPKKKAPAKTAGLGWFSSLGLQDIKLIIALVGVVGVVLVLIGVWGIRRTKNRFSPGDGAGMRPGPDGPGPRGRGGPREPGPPWNGPRGEGLPDRGGPRGARPRPPQGARSHAGIDEPTGELGTVPAGRARVGGRPGPSPAGGPRGRRGPEPYDAPLPGAGREPRRAPDRDDDPGYYPPRGGGYWSS